MALGGLPPWLNVQPSDFVHAAAAGASLGHAIADSTLRAWEEQARMRMASQEAQANREQHAQQLAVENAMTRLAADRLEQYRRSEIANRQAELGLQKQGLGLRGEALDVARQRNEDMYNLRDAALKAASGREEDKQTYREELNKFRDREADRRDKELDRRNREFEERQTTLQPHYFTGPDGNQYVVPRGGTNAVPINIPQSGTNTDTSPIGDFLKKAWHSVVGQQTVPSTGSIPMNPVYPNRNDVAAPPPSQTPTVTTKADYDALESGTIYTGKDGNQYRKP